VTIPETCADEDAALAQPLAVGIHAVERAGITSGDTVVLLGVGAIGSFILAALGRHDGPIIALDIDEERLASARVLGASRTELISRDETPADLRDLLPEGAQRVFETSGVPGAAERAIALAARGGTVVLVGLTKSAQALNVADVVLREVTLQTTVAHVCGSDLPAALQLLDRMPLAPQLLHGVVPLERAEADGLQALVEGRIRGKVLVDPRG
jgi:(R,R)-butanediol dehydrogenase/meso-butanediol dehydrogenase/diacetyl reductase